MAEKLNFVMTGSIAGGRGLEALLVLNQLPKVTAHFGRCIVVVWENEAHGEVFETLKSSPVELIVARNPKRTSFGFMEQQYKSLLAAMPYFNSNDIIVRVRTDFNYVLRPTISFLNRLLDAGKSAVEVLRGRIVCGEVSILHPGRIQEFNFAGTKKSLDMIGWCESFFTEDYNPVDMEPEFRWFGLEYVKEEPLFHYCYENRNMRALMQRFFDAHYSEGKCSADALPQIIKYMGWRIANISLERFICCLNLGPRNISPDTVYNAVNRNVSVYHPNIPDIRLSCHSALADVANIAPASPAWRSYIEAASEVADQEKKAPGFTIELFEKTFGKNPEKNAAVGYTPVRSNSPDNATTKSLAAFTTSLVDATETPFASFRDYPSDTLHALRQTNNSAILIAADHILSFAGLKDQMVNRYTTFVVTVLCRLIELGAFEKADELLTFLAAHKDGDTLEELVRVVAYRSRRFKPCPYEKQSKTYHVPERALDHDMLLDLTSALHRLSEHCPASPDTALARAVTLSSDALANKA